MHDPTWTASALLVFWVIYDHPRDFPDHFVLRRQFVKAHAFQAIPRELAPYGTVVGSDHLIAVDRAARIADSLDAARAMLPQGLRRFPRHPTDVPCIVEVWLQPSAWGRR